MAAYGAGVPRGSLDAVRRVRERSVAPSPLRRVVVVGTNGKSSVAAYLSRLLVGAGRRVGLYTSPHLRSWTERIVIDGEPVSGADFARAMGVIHEVATSLVESERPGDLRFFDVLTLTAEELFAAQVLEFGVFEAGIGGRLDATRVLDAELVVLTSIGADHEALLGWSSVERLREKALATPPGGELLCAPLGPELEGELPSIAQEGGFSVSVLEAVPGEGAQSANLRLARAAASRLLGGEAELPAIEVGVAGRSQRGVVDNVPYVVDVAHNPTAWRAFLGELSESPHVVVAAVTEPRPASSFVEVLAREGRAKVGTVFATTTTVRPTAPPAELAAALVAAGIDAHGAHDPFVAFDEALATCRVSGRPLAVFGSNFLVVDFLAWLRDRA